MTTELPTSVQQYFDLTTPFAPRELAGCFSSDAVVLDEQRRHEGLVAIQAWMAETFQKYQQTSNPVNCVVRPGEASVQALVTGNFPGSPAMLNFAFRLREGMVVELSIG